MKGAEEINHKSPSEERLEKMLLVNRKITGFCLSIQNNLSVFQDLNFGDNFIACFKTEFGSREQDKVIGLLNGVSEKFDELYQFTSKMKEDFLKIWDGILTEDELLDFKDYHEHRIEERMKDVYNPLEKIELEKKKVVFDLSEIERKKISLLEDYYYSSKRVEALIEEKEKVERVEKEKVERVEKEKVEKGRVEDPKMPKKEKKIEKKEKKKDLLEKRELRHRNFGIDLDDEEEIIENSEDDSELLRILKKSKEDF